MVKVIVLLPRRADMSPEAFKQHLRETHLPLVTKPGRPIRSWSRGRSAGRRAPPDATSRAARTWFAAANHGGS
jgi:hypothetical protein